MKRIPSILLHIGLPLALVAALIAFADAQSWSGEATGWGITAILGGATAIDLFASRQISKRRHRA